MNEFYTKFYQKQKNSETIKKNITKEMKSNPIIYDRNPTYMNFQSDIFYTPESSLNVYTSYNDAYYNYDYYNYYINKNNQLFKSIDNFTKSVSVHKNKGSKDNSKNYFYNSNTFNNKLQNSINSDKNEKNIIYNTINNINNFNYYNFHTFNGHLRSNNSYDFNNKFHSLENSINHFYKINSSLENNYKSNKTYHVTDIYDYFNQDLNNIEAIKKNKNNYIYVKEQNNKTEHNTDNKEEKFKKINILNGSAIIQRNGNLKDNNTIYISNLNKKIDLSEHNDKINNNEIPIYKIQNNKIKNGRIIRIKKINNTHILRDNSLKNGDDFNVNSNIIKDNNNIREYHKKKNISKKNIIPISDIKINKIYYKNSKKQKVLRKKLNLNISKKNNNLIIKREIIHFNNINILDIPNIKPKNLSNGKNSATKLSKKNIKTQPSNNFFVTIDVTKNNKLQEKDQNENKKEINYIQDKKIIKKECEICHIFVAAYLYRTHHMNHPSQILKFLYLGNYKHSSDNKELKKLKINYILNCAIECHNYNLPKNIKELHLKVKDSETFDILNYFDTANEFINKCKLMGGICLVHCKLGVSRSTTFVIAYLIKYANLTTDEAFAFVKSKRSSIKPNDGFMRQLFMYEKILKENQQIEIN